LFPHVDFDPQHLGPNLQMQDIWVRSVQRGNAGLGYHNHGSFVLFQHGSFDPQHLASKLQV
jgi:hypothetical protein